MSLHISLPSAAFGARISYVMCDNDVLVMCEQFQLFATLQSAASESLPGVYAYLINCKQTVADTLPFPKQFGPWKDGCYLYEPLEGTALPRIETVKSVLFM